MKIDYDVIIVGAGPAGISAAIYLQRSNLNCCIIEKNVPGGLINKTSTVENYPGFNAISGPDLAAKLYDQLNYSKIKQYYEEVVEIIDEKDYKTVKTTKNEFKTKAVILAIGREPKRLENKNERELEGKGISFCSLCDGALYRGEEVSIVGGGNSALEEALYLATICKKVYILNRTDTLRGDEFLKNKVLNTKNIEVLYNTQVMEFNGENDILKSITIKEKEELKELDVKACFIFIGYAPATKFIKNLEILDEKGYIIVDKNGRTAVDGIYAAGDIIKKDLYQIVTASSDGAQAAVSCIKDLGIKEG